MASIASATAALKVTSAALSTFADGLSPSALVREVPPLLSTAEAEDTKALRMPQFLSEADIVQLYAATAEKPHDVTYSKEHVAINLHRDGYFHACCPALSKKVPAGIRARAHAPDGERPFSAVGRDVPLNVRCVEFHTYRVGGGVMMKGHRDFGSVFTLSVLLSDPSGFDGGELLTWQDGHAETHPMERGDALLFHSEKAHNVTTVTRGVRHSLVVELWQGQSNRRDRYS
jgi:hypothetical protein